MAETMKTLPEDVDVLDLTEDLEANWAGDLFRQSSLLCCLEQFILQLLKLYIVRNFQYAVKVFV